MGWAGSRGGGGLVAHFGGSPPAVGGGGKASNEDGEARRHPRARQSDDVAAADQGVRGADKVGEERARRGMKARGVEGRTGHDLITLSYPLVITSGV